MQDLRDALRTLRASPLVTTIAVLSLGLGIGANTAMFSIVDSLLLRALPVQHASRLAVLLQDGEQGSWTNPIWEEIRNRPQLFDDAFAYSSTRFNLAPSGPAEYIDGIFASGGFFSTMGVPAVIGRTFTPTDDKRGGGPDGAVAVISYAYWQRQYAGAADVLGRAITLNRVAYTIIGVTPPEFFGPDVGRSFDVVVPIGTEPLLRGAESSLDRRSTWWLGIMVRLKPGQSPEASTAALRAVQSQIREATIPEKWRPQDVAKYLNEKNTFSLKSASGGQSYMRGRYERPLVTLMVVVSLVLLIACGNIANLLLARATVRRHELSVRTALGASRWRLARQLLAESLTLSALGAMLGGLIAYWGSRFLVTQLSTDRAAVFLDLSLNWRMLGFTAAVAIATALLFGVAPAMRASRTEPIDAMREYGRGTTSERRVGLAGGLVTAQVALSLILVIAAGLFVRTFSSLSTLKLGFERNRVLVVSINAQRTGLDTAGLLSLYERLRLTTAAVPGVSSAAASVVTPVSGSSWTYRVLVPGGMELPEEKRGSYVNYVTPTWFATYGTPILSGRDFSDHDVATSPRVAIVNQTFVRRFLGDVNPLGRTLRNDGGPSSDPTPVEIVGVVSDAVYRSLRDTIPPTLYMPLAQSNNFLTSISLSVRSAGAEPAQLTKSLASTLGTAQADLSVSFRALSTQVEASLTQERLVAMLSAFFGGLALLLAALGLYGVTAYSVSRRRVEIGIRMALGTTPIGVVQLVLARVARMVGVGVLIGVGVSWYFSRFVASLLYGLAPRDPVTVLGAVGVLIGVAGLAGWLPARRAAGIDPATVLREG